MQDKRSPMARAGHRATVLPPVASWSKKAAMRGAWAAVLAAMLLALVAGPAMAQGPVQVLVVEKGQVFKITLAANHTTGYRWVLAALPPAKVVKLVNNTYEPAGAKDKDGKPLLGAGGREVWTFQAVGRGTAFISLHYVRPWEKDKPPAKSRSLEVRVP